ncbi:MAG: DUF937 domain-containing protein [Gammaproteobacteria bacterium]
MAINLVDIVMDHLKGPVINQLGGLIGESPERTKAAATGIVPALLSGLVGTVSKPNGESIVSSLLDKVDDGLLDKLGSLLGGQQAKTVSETSSNLSTLLGKNMVTNLVSEIVKLFGLGSGPTKSLLGLLVPIAFGAVKRLARNKGLDVGGLADMLRGQEGNIAKAMPSGLSNLLGSTGALSEAAESAIGAGQQAPSTEAPKSILRWLIPVIILAGLALFLWQSGQRPQETVRTATQQVDSGALLTKIVDSASNILSSISSVDAAKTALPKLHDLNTQIDNLTPVVSSLPQSAKDTIAGLASKALRALQANIDRVIALPGVKPVIEPAVEAMKKKLRALGAE